MSISERLAASGYNEVRATILAHPSVLKVVEFILQAAACPADKKTEVEGKLNDVMVGQVIGYQLGAFYAKQRDKFEVPASWRFDLPMSSSGVYTAFFEAGLSVDDLVDDDVRLHVGHDKVIKYQRGQKPQWLLGTPGK